MNRVTIKNVQYKDIIITFDRVQIGELFAFVYKKNGKITHLTPKMKVTPHLAMDIGSKKETNLTSEILWLWLAHVGLNNNYRNKDSRVGVFSHPFPMVFTFSDTNSFLRVQKCTNSSISNNYVKLQNLFRGSERNDFMLFHLFLDTFST